MSDIVRTSIAAINELHTSLARFEAEALAAAADAARRIEQALAEAQSAVSARTAELQRCEAALAACRRVRSDPPPDCSGHARAVAGARAKLESARAAARVLTHEQTTHVAARSRFEHEVAHLVGIGRDRLNTHRLELQQFLAGGGHPIRDGFVGAVVATAQVLSNVQAVISSLAPTGIDGHPLVSQEEQDLADHDEGRRKRERETGIELGYALREPDEVYQRDRDPGPGRR